VHAPIQIFQLKKQSRNKSHSAQQTFSGIVIANHEQQCSSSSRFEKNSSFICLPNISSLRLTAGARTWGPWVTLKISNLTKNFLGQFWFWQVIQYSIHSTFGTNRISKYFFPEECNFLFCMHNKNFFLYFLSTCI